MMTLYVNFDVKTDPNTDQILAQMRQGQAESQMPTDVRSYGVTVQKSTVAPLIMFDLYSPNGTYDEVFLANYSLHQHQRPDDPSPRDRQRPGVRRGPVRYALLGEAGSARQAQHHHP